MINKTIWIEIKDKYKFNCLAKYLAKICLDIKRKITFFLFYNKIEYKF